MHAFYVMAHKCGHAFFLPEFINEHQLFHGFAHSGQLGGDFKSRHRMTAESDNNIGSGGF